MVRIVQPSLPPQYEEAWNRIFRWFSRYGVPVWCRSWVQDTRRGVAVRRSATQLRAVADCWNALSVSERLAWDSAAFETFGFYRGYRLFTSDYFYRKKIKLTYPGSPSDLHQMEGIMMKNPGGTQNVYSRYDDKDLVGQFTIKFSYKKKEIAASGSFGFKVQTTAYYLIEGGIGTETDEFSGPSGNVDWTQITRTIGTAGRKYFHIKIVWTIENYNAEIWLDNFRLTDSVGLIYFENFDTIEYNPWEFEKLIRKKWWQFSPGFWAPYFYHTYLP